MKFSKTFVGLLFLIIIALFGPYLYISTTTKFTPTPNSYGIGETIGYVFSIFITTVISLIVLLIFTIFLYIFSKKNKKKQVRK